MKLIYLVVFIIIIIIGIYLYLFIQDRKNKGKENKETYLKTKELHDLSRDVHSDNYEISTLSYWKGCTKHPFHLNKKRVLRLSVKLTSSLFR